jgi:hypothetical protein
VAASAFLPDRVIELSSFASVFALARFVLFNWARGKHWVLETQRMKTVEIITVRLDPRRDDSLLRELRQTLETQGVSNDRISVELYRHATVKTDVSIHLRSDSLQADGPPSVLGQRLACALREFGAINHSAWFEEGRR